MAPIRIQPIRLAKSSPCHLTYIPKVLTFKIISKIPQKNMIVNQRVCKLFGNLFRYICPGSIEQSKRSLIIIVSNSIKIMIINQNRAVLFRADFKTGQSKELSNFLKAITPIKFGIIGIQRGEIQDKIAANTWTKLMAPLLERTRLSCILFRSLSIDLSTTILDGIDYEKIEYYNEKVENFLECVKSKNLRNCPGIEIEVPGLNPSDVLDIFKENKFITIFGNDYTTPRYCIPLIMALMAVDTKKHCFQRLEIKRSDPSFQPANYIYYSQEVKGVHMLFDDLDQFCGFWFKTLTQYAAIVVDKQRGYKGIYVFESKIEILLFFVEWMLFNYATYPVPIDMSPYFEKISKSEDEFNILAAICDDILNIHYLFDEVLMSDDDDEEEVGEEDEYLE